MLDDSTRRQLRFALFLQCFAALMLVATLVIRVTALGWDVVAAVFALGVVVVGTAIGFTLGRLRG